MVYYSNICRFDWDLLGMSRDGGMVVTSNQTESNVYEFVVTRTLWDVKNPPERVKLAIIDKETTAVEEEDYHLSTKELVFDKGSCFTSFQLTIMAVNVEKTLTLKLDYTHPQMGNATTLDGEPYESPYHFAKFRIVP